MKAMFTYALTALIFFFSAHAWADAIPPHLASMAAQLYKGIEKELEDKSVSVERRKALEESSKTLRVLGIHRWSKTPPKISDRVKEVAEKLKLDPKQDEDRKLLNAFLNQRANEGTENALRGFGNKTEQEFTVDERNALVADIDAVMSKSVEKLEKTYVTNPQDGRSVQMKWNPDEGKFVMKVLDDGSGGSEQFATAMSGEINSRIGENGQDMTLEVNPSEKPVKVLTAADIEGLQGNIIGEWKAEDGTVFQFSAGSKQAGKIRSPREVYDKQIERLKEKIKTVKDAKIFEWQNPKTGEVIRQNKFRNLKEPFEYLGEKYALNSAEEETANYEKKIADLKSERDGVNLAPVDKHDPAGFGEVSSSDGTRPITITVTLPNGHVYTYDEAVFDGRRISAKRTYKVVPDFINQKLPDIIKRKLLSEGWNPPGWLELDASINAETGEVSLDGRQWSMHVTYSSFLGDPPDIDRIHTPYSWKVTLSKGGAIFKIAEGAAENLMP